MTPAGPAPRVLVTRPREDAAGLTAALEQRGLTVLLQPMLEIEFADGAAPDLDGRQALLFTSANGVRAFVRSSDQRDIPVYAVGDATAAAARHEGFTAVESAGGDVGDLARLVQRRCDPGGGPLLHVAGSAVAGDLAGTLGLAEFVVERVQMYSARTADKLDPHVQAAVTGGAVDYVLFFSPRSAVTFVGLARAADLAAACARIDAVCLSDAVAEVLSPIQWRDTAVAAAPTQDALLDCLERKIKEGGHAAMTSPDSDNDLLSDGSATAIIERFGGIRPMAAKLNMPVTTVQGWKARGRIPANRAAALRAAAAEHGIDLSMAATAAVPDAASASPVEAPVSEPDTAPAQPDGDSDPEPIADDTARTDAAEPDEPSSEAQILESDEAPPPPPAARQSGIAWLALVVAVLAGAGLVTQRYWTPYLGVGPAATGAGSSGADSAAVEALSGRVAKLESMEQKVSGVEGRLRRLDQRVAALPKDAGGTGGGEALAAINKQLATTKQAVDDMTTRLTALEAKAGATPPPVANALSTLQQTMTSMRESVSALTTRVKALEDRPLISGERIAALAVAAGQLDSMVSAGRPYDGALARLKALASGDKAMSAAIATLGKDAETGVPTLAVLTRRFDRIAPKLAPAGQPEQAAGWLGKVREKTMSLVNMRPVGAQGAASPVTRSEQALARGDLAAAMKELDAVTGPLDTWRADAQRRLAVDAAVAAINVQVVDRLTSSAGTAAATPAKQERVSQ